MATETLRPNAPGDETSIPSQEPDSGAHWEKVDEAEADDNTTYVWGDFQNESKRDLYNIPNHSEGIGTINKITVHIRCKGEDTTRSKVRASIKSNTTVTDGAQKSFAASNTWEDFSQEWATNPADSEAWEWADIDALQIGVYIGTIYNLIRRQVYCTQLYVEVDYTAVTPKTSSDAGSGVDTVDSLEKGEVKTSSDAGSGVEGTPMQSAILVGSETGFSIEALITRLLTGDETGTGIEVGGLLKDLFVSELGQGSDSFTAKIEAPTKGGGMKLWI